MDNQQNGSAPKATNSHAEEAGASTTTPNTAQPPDAVREDGDASPTDEGPAMPPVVIDPTKDLWQNIALNTKENHVTQTEVHMLVVGSPGGGKTTVLQRLFAAINTSSNAPGKTTLKVKPTTALDYTFARRNDRHISQVAHFWELAQGMELSQLCDVVITPENVHTMMLTIVVDCGDPSTMWETTAYWLKRIDRRVMEITQKMRAKGSATPDKLQARAKRTIGETHPDLGRLRLSGVPTIVVCNKLDAFAGDMTQLKAMVRCMRYIVHMYGAYLVFTSENDTTKLRSLMSHIIFLAPLDSRHIELDPERGAVLVVPDADTFADIGDPMVHDMGDFRSTGDVELDRWKAPFDAMFPPKRSEGRMQNDSFLKKLYDTGDGGFGEPTIDAMRKQKDEELEQHRKGALKGEKVGKEEKGKAREKKEKA
ncbi:putative dynein light intermediate chain [Trypanosoma grayi]|uniref:putative dynein light intermediate chain n=1 Tax=Trypanosoma grayi TaxID=71804 RepID=UPI0004F46C8F|nr:putative dynein light intermediate chain [Trypanosoma grayi]KEG10622.1 putative dynein light intermediate chain [Trypanosoma grayi]